MHKRTLIIGLGLSGCAVANFLLRRGVSVVGIDRNQALIETNEAVKAACRQGMQVYCDGAPCGEAWRSMQQYDLVVISPGIPPSHVCIEAAKAAGIEVIAEIELACRELGKGRHSNKKCVGVTGTNGKTTVTMMIAHILNHAGIKARALGNIGIPLTSAFDDESSNDCQVFVVELSSFQLEAFQYPCLDVGVLLNITPDHLDRYSSMEAYALAKIRIGKCIKSDGIFVIENRCLHEYQQLFQKPTHCEYHTYGYVPDCFIYTDTHSMNLNHTLQFILPSQYQGKQSHDVENLMAVYAVCERLGVHPDQFIEGLLSFKKPPHRIEFVRTVNGVHYYDDSKGTNVDAVIRAVNAIEGKIILIAGGVDKHFPYTSWLAAFDTRVKSIYAIGQAAEKIKNELGHQIPVTICESLEKAIMNATCHASPGNVVLLSPGCASYDMFNDYAHRGMEFQRIVRAL